MSNVIEMPVFLLKTDKGTQRRQINLEVVTQYAEQMAEGAKFDPIDAVYDGKDYIVWNGFHRVNAYKKANIKMVRVSVTDGDAAEAIHLSLGANKDSLQRTQAEKNACARVMITDPRYEAWTDEQRANHIGVSRSTIARVKADIESGNNSGQGDSNVVSLTQNETSAVGNEEENVDSSDTNTDSTKPKYPTDKVGNKIPDHLIDVFARQSEIRACMNTLDEMRRNTEEKCEALDPLWFFLPLNPLQTQTANTKRIYRFSLPYCVCPMHGAARLEDARDCKLCKGAGWITEDLYQAVPREFKEEGRGDG